MKLYRACHGNELSPDVKEIWFTSDKHYLSRVSVWRDVSHIVEIDIDESVIRQHARRHGKKSLPTQWQKIKPFHSGDNKIQVKFEHGAINFGFYGNTINLVLPLLIDETKSTKLTDERS